MLKAHSRLSHSPSGLTVHNGSQLLPEIRAVISVFVWTFLIWRIGRTCGNSSKQGLGIWRKRVYHLLQLANQAFQKLLSSKQIVDPRLYIRQLFLGFAQRVGIGRVHSKRLLPYTKDYVTDR